MSRHKAECVLLRVTGALSVAWWLRFRKIILVRAQHFYHPKILWAEGDDNGMVPPIDSVDLGKEPVFVTDDRLIFLNQLFPDLSLDLTDGARPDIIGQCANVSVD